MSPESERDPAWAQLEDFRRDTAGIQHGWADFLRERLSRWAIRWTVGFIGILIVTAFFPELAWLWWAGISLAVLSFFVMLAVHWLILRKLARAKTSLDDLESTLEELEADSLLNDDRRD